MIGPVVTHQRMREMQAGPVKVVRWKTDKRNRTLSSLRGFQTADKALAWLREDIEKFSKAPRDPKTGAFEGRPTWRVIAEGDFIVLKVNEYGIDRGLWA